MQRPSFRVALGSVLILAAAACGTATDGETTSTPEIALAPTGSTATSTTVRTTSTVAGTLVHEGDEVYGGVATTMRRT